MCVAGRMSTDLRIAAIADIPDGNRRDGPVVSSTGQDGLPSIEMPALSVGAGASFLNFTSNTTT